MVVSIVLISLGMVGMSAFLYGKLVKYNMTTTVIKTVTSLLFVALAIYLFIYNDYPTLGAFVIASTILGTFGDVFLALKRVYPNKNKLYMILGMVAFMIGHIVLIIGLHLTYNPTGNVVAIIVPLVCALIVSICFIYIEMKTGVDLTHFKGPAITYIFLVTSVMATSLSLLILNSFNNTAAIIMFSGNILFMMSDMLLCRTYFGKPKLFNLVGCTVTYYFAQFIIAFSLFFI